MKKIIFLFVLVIAIGLISGHKQPAQNEMTEKYAKPDSLKDFKSASKFDIRESKGDTEPFTLKNMPEGSSRILLILYNDTGLAAWSPSLWWSYQQANSGQSGC
jgi:hypothetical protein